MGAWGRLTELWVGGSYSIATLVFLGSMVVPRLCCFLHARQLSPPASLVQSRALCMCLLMYPAALLSTRRRRGPRQQPPLVRKSPLPKPDSAHALSCWIWLVNYWHLHLHNCNSRSGCPMRWPARRCRRMMSGASTGGHMHAASQCGPSAQRCSGAKWKRPWASYLRL